MFIQIFFNSALFSSVDPRKQALKELFTLAGNPESPLNVDKLFNFIIQKINQGADINGCNEEKVTLLSYAVFSNNVPFVMALLRHQVDPNERSHVYENTWKNILLGVDPSKFIDLQTALMTAITKNFGKLINLLSNYDKTDLTVRGKENDTLLHYLAKFESTEGVALLKKVLDSKIIDINAENNFGATAIFLAACHSNKKILECLLSQPDIRFDKEIVGYNVVSRVACDRSDEELKLFISSPAMKLELLQTALEEVKKKIAIANYKEFSLLNEKKAILDRTIATWNK